MQLNIRTRRRRLLAAGAATAVLLGGAGAGVAAATGGGHTADSDDATLAKTATVDIKQAADTALKAVPGGRVTAAELSREHGAVVWEVDVVDTKKTEHEVKIAADSGKVVNNAVDREADDDHGEDD